MRPLVLLTILAAALALLFVSAESFNHRHNNPQIVPHPVDDMLAVSFAHADHVQQPCVECHHNFVDATGIGMCFDCHNTDPTVSHLIEQQFHDLCRNCHLAEQAAGNDHGPTRQCIACHVKDNKP